jgi:hypothetical protein
MKLVVKKHIGLIKPKQSEGKIVVTSAVPQAKAKPFGAIVFNILQKNIVKQDRVVGVVVRKKQTNSILKQND